MKFVFDRLKFFENRVIDTILDKISDNGIDSLSDKERKNLEDFSNDVEIDTTKDDLIESIKSLVTEQNDCISMLDKDDVYIREDGDYYEVILVLDTDTVDVGKYRGDDFIDDYTLEYEELELDILQKIYFAIV